MVSKFDREFFLIPENGGRVMRINMVGSELPGLDHEFYFQFASISAGNLKFRPYHRIGPDTKPN
jgi:hypothetical protein